MKNTTRILKGILEESTVEVDLNLETSSIEVEDTKFYLYATLEIKEPGYEFDFSLARKTSRTVSSETLELIPLKEIHEKMIAEHLLEAMETAAESEIEEPEGFIIPERIHNLY